VSALFIVIGVAMYASLAVLAFGGPLLRLWRWARRTDTFEPAAAEAPESDAAFADVQRVFAGQFDAQGDLLAPPDYQPSVAAASDLDGSGLMFEVYEAIDRYRRGEAIDQDAPRERA
jgi:hypothetical protein